jgi:hypothetical protein
MGGVGKHPDILELLEVILIDDQLPSGCHLGLSGSPQVDLSTFPDERPINHSSINLQ